MREVFAVEVCLLQTPVGLQVLPDGSDGGGRVGG